MASNVYTKLNQARIKMQELGLKQNGVNGYANYKYFELADILPASNKICDEIKATIYTQFDDKAHLFFVDNEGDGVVEFTLPMSTASLKGCHEVQNLGAVQTYLKRYLYQNCYELSECDALDMTMNPKPKPEAKAEPKPETKNLADVMVTFKTKAEAELTVQKFETLADDGYITQDSLANMKNAYSKLKSENEYRQFIANCRANISKAEVKKIKEPKVEQAQNFKDEEIPF